MTNRWYKCGLQLPLPGHGSPGTPPGARPGGGGTLASTWWPEEATWDPPSCACRLDFTPVSESVAFLRLQVAEWILTIVCAYGPNSKV